MSHYLILSGKGPEVYQCAAKNTERCSWSIMCGFCNNPLKTEQTLLRLINKVDTNDHSNKRFFKECVAALASVVQWLDWRPTQVQV